MLNFTNSVINTSRFLGFFRNIRLHDFWMNSIISSIIFITRDVLAKFDWLFDKAATFGFLIHYLAFLTNFIQHCIMIFILIWTWSWSEFCINKYIFGHSHLLTWKEFSFVDFGPVESDVVLRRWFFVLHLVNIFSQEVLSFFFLWNSNILNFVIWFETLSPLDVVASHSKFRTVDGEFLFVTSFDHFINSVWNCSFGTRVEWFEISITLS